MSFLASLLAVEGIRRWAARLRLLDIPNERSSHTKPTPRGGGIVIAASALLGLALLAARDPMAPPGGWSYLYGGMIILLIGGIDDILRLPSGFRLLVQVLAVCVVVLSGPYIDAVELPGFGRVGLGQFGVAVTFFWIVGLVNVFNFMDGIDGLAACQSIIGSCAWILYLHGTHASAVLVLPYLLVGSSLGFLVHNFPPARVFMGDVGSTVLGYAFAVIPLLAYSRTSDAHSLGVGVLCVAPFAFDGALTIVRRAIGRQNLLQAHRSHLYQRLAQLGYSHGEIGLVYGGLSLISGLAAQGYASGDRWIASLVLAVEALVLVGFAAWVTSEEKRHGQPAASRSRVSGQAGR